MSEYNQYQNRYYSNIRESDKVIISEVLKYIETSDHNDIELLDIGCSTGNLLHHLSLATTNINFTGGDIAESSLALCKQNKDLSHVKFEIMDILNLNCVSQYDIIIANAVCVYFKWSDYKSAIQQVYQSLKPGGIFIAFEWLHPFACQDITIYETTMNHPNGIRICFRPIPKVKNALQSIGFSSSEFREFILPFDQDRPSYEAEVTTYTIPTHDSRLMFRGALYQPWCHLIAKK